MIASGNALTWEMQLQLGPTGIWGYVVTLSRSFNESWTSQWTSTGYDDLEKARAKAVTDLTHLMSHFGLKPVRGGSTVPLEESNACTTE